MVKVMILDEEDKRTAMTRICRLDLKRSHIERMNFMADVNQMVAEFIHEYKHQKGGEKP